MAEEALVSVEDGVMTIVINRPDQRNALNGAVAQIVGPALERLDETDEAQVAIITGAGGTFSSGMDLKGFLKGDRPVYKDRGLLGLSHTSYKKPIIAAVEGFAVAGGMELALACDMIVAAENSKFGIPEAKRGLIAAGGGVMRLPKRVGAAIAMELAMTGDTIDAERAYQVGLVNRLSEPGKALEVAQGLAKTISANGPLAIAASKRIILESADWSEDEMWDKQEKIIRPVFNSEDAREGATAFAEKRKPNWQGK